MCCFCLLVFVYVFCSSGLFALGCAQPRLRLLIHSLFCCALFVVVFFVFVLLFVMSRDLILFWGCKFVCGFVSFSILFCLCVFDLMCLFYGDGVCVVFVRSVSFLFVLSKSSHNHRYHHHDHHHHSPTHKYKLSRFAYSLLVLLRVVL